MSDSTELTIATPTVAIQRKGFNEIQLMAEQLAKSSLLPAALKGKVPDLIFSILAGQELGLGPVASIRGIHIIQGKPILAADTMMGLVLGSGLAEYFVQTESTATSVTFETKRKGSPVAQRCTWTMEDAKRALLSRKDTWIQYPRQMLASRCKAELARSAYPDILAGCYDPDEMSVPVSQVSVVSSNEIEDAVVVDTPPPPRDDTADAFIASIESAQTMAELMGVAASPARPLKGSPAYDAAITAYNVRKSELERAS